MLYWKETEAYVLCNKSAKGITKKAFKDLKYLRNEIILIGEKNKIFQPKINK